MLSRQIKYFLTKCRLTSLALLEEDYDYTGEIQREKLLWTTRAGSCIGLGVAELEGWNRICWSQLLQFILKRNIYQKRIAELNLVALLYSLYSSTFPNFLSADACIVQEYIISKSLSGKSFAISSEERSKPQALVCHWWKEATTWERLVQKLPATLHHPIQVWKPQILPTKGISEHKVIKVIFAWQHGTK